MLRQGHCEKWTLDEDPHLVSKCAYHAILPDYGGMFFWVLGYVHERLSSVGEGRTYFKWCCYVRDTLQVLDMMGDEPNCGVFVSSKTDPPGSVAEHVASTKGIMAFLLIGVMQRSKTTAFLRHVTNWVREVSRIAVRALDRPWDVVCGEGDDTF